MKEIFMNLKDNNIMFVPTIDNGPITRYHVVSRFVLYESMNRYGFITWGQTCTFLLSTMWSHLKKYVKHNDEGA